MVKRRKPKEPTWIRAIKRVTISCRRMKRQEVLTFIVFVLISAFFWVIETASEENDATYQIEFRVENQPANIVFTTLVPKQLKVSIKDKNINLLDYSYHNIIDTLTVDFNRYNDALGNFRISGAELQALLINRLFPSTKITALSPSIIDAKFAITGGKTLPVKTLVKVSPADNYRIHPISVSPDSVLVHAPSSVLDTISNICTTLYEAIGLKDTIKLSLPLKLEVGVKSTPDVVDVMIPVAQFVEKTITGVNINVIDVPNGEDMSIFPNRTDLTFLVDLSHYSEITKEDFYLTVSYNSIKSSNQTFIPVEIISYANPELVTNVKAKNTQVEYIIENNE